MDRVKDIDFDELDRAVNSLNVTAPPVNNTDNSAVPMQSPTTDATSITAPAATTPLAARRSTGQFMDVVHPSSNMRPSTVTIPERPAFQTSSVNPVTSTTPSANSDGWPDPIDFTSTNKTDTVKDNNEDDDINKISDDITKSLGQTENPIESPFLSGTTVEKRPLGAFSTEPVVEDMAPKMPDLQNSMPTDNVDTTKPSDPKIPMPAELQDDLLSIESNDDVTPEAAEAPKTSAPFTPIQDNDTAKAPTPMPQPTGATSIAQQYKEQPSTGDQNSAAIYNADNYPKSVVTPVKKKSGWMWVLWIIILLIVGAGTGAAVYFFVLPNLV